MILRHGTAFLRQPPHRRALAGLAAWSVVEAAQTFTTGYALARALDDGFLAGRPAAGLAWLAAAAVAVAAGAYGTGRTYRQVAGLAEPLRDALVRRVVARALHDADGAAVSRLTHQVEIARDTFAGLLMVARSFVFTAAGALAGLFLLAPVLLAVVVPPLVLGLALFVLTLRPLARRQEAYLAADEALSQSSDAVCAGLRDVTAGGAERVVEAGTGALVDEGLRTANALARWSVTRVVALAVAGRLPVVPLLLATPWLLDHGVTPGALVGALAYLTQSLLPALQSLVHGLGTSGSRLVVVLRRLTAPASAPDAVPPASCPVPPGGPAVELRGVTFGYGRHAEPVLRGLDLTLPVGGRLAVVGPSGVGKSTLAALVAGLLGPWEGEVRVGGAPARAPGAAARRVLIPQEAYVFSGTLGENLRYLRDDPVGDREVLAAADAVGAAALVRRLGGLAAPLVPDELSAGERQLVALARAYLSPAPVVILDEAACHLDPAAEARAERAFAARPGGSLVVVAHRAGSALRADRVLVMDGPGTAAGTHAELLARSALYRDLMGAGGSDPAGALGDADGVDAVAGPGLAGDGGHVVAHGAVRQVQAARDLADGGAAGGQ
ncbi:ATP-binding cassette domain-containing protein [Streptomyces griseocarneus]|uniref:ATP-binding cassette domain-containing protein n=1 Tax=Streptomyces griseocarneus TaxID=51201 RepID=UPI00199A1C81|nr:ABC transporter ATP-binding protein [Streptomyces griseocarneus]MBZ6472174.1 ABC transporter ATP-binding protein/permease [Streptomyces griseocarneus]GHG73450.1 ABC transporter ATP-binding protein [Streptomyces griseocarneus]